MPANDRIKIRRGPATLWESRNPILLDGEPGYDTTNHVVKIGDGSTRWNDLEGVGSDAGQPAPTPAGTSYSYRKLTPAAEWVINHGLGRPIEPVVLLDSDPTRPILTDIEHPSLNTSVLTFPSPTSGWAYYF